MAPKELPSETLRREISLSGYITSKFPDISLSGSSGHYRCRCPIHGGTNPSVFSIDDEKGYWKCFAECGSGTIIDLWLRLHDRDDSDAKAAMEALSEETGVQIRSGGNGNSQELTRHALTKVVEAVCRDAHDLLVKNKGSAAHEALEYLYGRGLSDDDLDDWTIGLLPPRKKVVSFMTAAASEVVGPKRAAEALAETQLVEDSKYGDDRYSQFASRIVFPIRDASGNFVGVSARILPSDDVVSEKTGKAKSKYVNSRTSDLFDKSSVLFGMHNVVTYGANKTQRVFICEGQMDVISMMWVLGDTEIAAATCGTALTEQHMAWLARVGKVTLMFDGDEAGQKALVKALPIVNICGSRNVRSLVLASGKDANEIAAADEERLIADLKTGEGDYLDAVARVLWRQADESPHEFYRTARDSLSMLKRSVERQHLVDALAAASGLPNADVSREISMTAVAKKVSSVKTTKTDTATVSGQIAPLLTWMSHLATKTRSTLLLDLDIWLNSDYVTEDILCVQNDTDEDVLAFIAKGVDMAETYGDDSTATAEEIVATMAASDDPSSPRSFLVRAARLLLEDVRRGYLSRSHAPVLHSIATARSPLSEVEQFLRIGELLSETAEDDDD